MCFSDGLWGLSVFLQVCCDNVFLQVCGDIMFFCSFVRTVCFSRFVGTDGISLQFCGD